MSFLKKQVICIIEQIGEWEGFCNWWFKGAK